MSYAEKASDRIQKICDPQRVTHLRTELVQPLELSGVEWSGASVGTQTGTTIGLINTMPVLSSLGNM